MNQGVVAQQPDLVNVSVNQALIELADCGRINGEFTDDDTLGKVGVRPEELARLVGQKLVGHLRHNQLDLTEITADSTLAEFKAKIRMQLCQPPEPKQPFDYQRDIPPCHWGG